MPRLKVYFGDPEHGWMNVSISNNDVEFINFAASHIYYPSLSSLAAALLAMRDPCGKSTVHWMLEPAEVKMRFSKCEATVRLGIASFSASAHSLEGDNAEFIFAGTYDEICLPFWRALRNLEGRYSPEEWAGRWDSPFPRHELAVLTAQLGKN